MHAQLALLAMSTIGARSRRVSYGTCERALGAMVSGPGLPASSV
jgi:hypothetical protein